MNTVAIENRIKESFPGCEVMATDQTGSGSNFEIRVAAKEFQGLSRVAQPRKVMDIFAEELKSGEMHAVSLKLVAL